MTQPSARRRAETPPLRRSSDCSSASRAGYERASRIRESLGAKPEDDYYNNPFSYSIGYGLARIAGLPVFLSGALVYIAFYPVVLLVRCIKALLRFVIGLIAPIVLFFPKMVLMPVFFVFQCIAFGVGLCMCLALVAQISETLGVESDSFYLQELVKIWGSLKVWLVLRYHEQEQVLPDIMHEAWARARVEAEVASIYIAELFPESVKAHWATAVLFGHQAVDYMHTAAVELPKLLTREVALEYWYKLQVDAGRLAHEARQALPDTITFEDAMLMAKHGLPIAAILIIMFILVKVFLAPALTLLAILFAIAMAPVHLVVGFGSGVVASTGFWWKVLGLLGSLLA